MKDVIKRLQERYHYALVVFKELVKTNFKLRYQGSYLGVLWSVLQPLMLFTVMYVVFVKFLKFTDGTPTFPISLLCGTCLWQFFTESTSMGMRSIVDRGDLLRKIHFPNYIIVAATTMGSMISLAINLGVVILFGFFAHAHYTWRVITVIPSILQLYAISLGVALLLGSLYVYFRDIGHIWDVILQALFYATPIIYPLGRRLHDAHADHADDHGHPPQSAVAGIRADHLDRGGQQDPVPDPLRAVRAGAVAGRPRLP